MVDGSEVWVVGASGVVMVDAREATSAEGVASGVRLTLVGDGDTVDLTTLDVVRGEGKAALAALDPASEISIPEDPFERWALLHLVAELSRSEASTVSMRSGAVELVLTKAASFSASARSEVGVQETPAGLSAGPFELTIRAGA